MLQQANINKTEGNLLAKKKPEEQKQIIDKIKTGEAKTINNAILAVNRDKPREVKPLKVTCGMSYHLFNSLHSESRIEV